MRSQWVPPNIFNHFFLPQNAFRQPPLQTEQRESEPRSPLSNHDRLRKINFSFDSIPEQYMDCIFHHIFDDPVKLDGWHIIDYLKLTEWWQKSGRRNVNPFTNESYKTIEKMDDLKSEIAEFVSEQELLFDWQTKLESFIEKNNKYAAERLEKIQSKKNQRRELTNKIEESLSEANEQTLKLLFNKVERLDKKINLLMMEGKYPASKHILLQIEYLIEKCEQKKVSEKTRSKLKILLEKVDYQNNRKASRLHLISKHLTLFQSREEDGLPAVINENQGLLSRKSLSDL